ncbi:MAG: hypothetical protein K8M05_22465, partial [Deltaproteobacteria bacterium]|nr:hypothetical protein [Kofleriaceae bacterium]
AWPDDVPAETPGDLRSLMRKQPLAPAMATTASSPQARAAELSKLGFSMDPNAGTALYSLARTQHVDLGQHAQALRTLDAYFRRFDRSAPDFEAARWLRLRILCASSFDAKCRAAAHTYATEYPDARPDSRGGIADRIKNTP